MFYRVVSAGAVPKTEVGYRLVGRQLLKLRRAGRVSYADITDGTRWVTAPTTFRDKHQAARNTARAYRRNLWADQNVDVQIYTEKDAISGVILPVTDQWQIGLGVLRGYSSESFCWSVAQSVCDARGAVYVYQLGDHDPSGVDAWRAFSERVRMFALERYSATDWLHFERIAVTPEQIIALDLPTRPTKGTDTRAAGFGSDSVEVDAIPATTLREIVEDAITQHIDQRQLALTREVERQERLDLFDLAKTALGAWRHAERTDLNPLQHRQSSHVGAFVAVSDLQGVGKVFQSDVSGRHAGDEQVRVRARPLW